MLLSLNRVHTNSVAEGKTLPSLKEIIQIGYTFSLTLIAWVFFRAETVGDALSYLSGMFSSSLFTYPDVFPKTLLKFILIFVLIEWFQRDKQHALQLGEKDLKYPFIFRWAAYYLILLTIWQYGGAQQEFIYFQF